MTKCCVMKMRLDGKMKATLWKTLYTSSSAPLPAGLQTKVHRKQKSSKEKKDEDSQRGAKTHKQEVVKVQIKETAP